jgi:hypothetical protein
VTLDRWLSLQHLVRLGLVEPTDLVDDEITVTAMSSRNELVRVERSGRSGFVIKRPKDPAQLDSATMWTEAALFWLVANDPAFAPLAPWMPRYHHYDPLQRMLTIEFVAPAQSLAEKLFGLGVPPAVAAEAGRVFATLHGRVSAAANGSAGSRLFANMLPWALTLGFPDNRYVPVTQASASTLQAITGWADLMSALGGLRAGWRPERIIHGDAKAANLLILADGGVRLIDWEIASLGDPLWDIAGLIHSILVPNPAAPTEPLAAAQARARPLVESIWRAYLGAAPSLPPGRDTAAMLLAMTGARILQTCLECSHYGSLLPGTAGMIEMAAELMAAPRQARERWAWLQ